MDKAKKFIYPFAFSLACALCFFTAVFPILANAGLGGAVFALGFLAILFFVIIPVYCFIYGKKLLLTEKRKYLFSLYNSFVLTLFYLLPLCTEGETYIYSLILFLWATGWSMLPLIIYKKAEKTPTE